MDADVNAAASLTRLCLPSCRVRLQTQHEHGTGRRYKGVYSCFRSIIREEKVAGLFKGMASPLVGVAVANSLLFGVYGSALRHVASDIDAPTVSDIFWAGSISGFVNAFFSCPMELVKIRLQNQEAAANAAYKGPIDCIRKIVAKDGIRGLYKGFGTTIIRETPSYGAYFASYELMTRLILPPDADPSEPSARLLLAGGMAGVVGWLSTYPFDVVKTRLQSIEEDSTKKYKNLSNAFRVIAREEGYRVFFSGLGATAIRAFPTNAATFYVVVLVRNFMNSNLTGSAS
ncbi:mitochondrial carrier domain-containing protein [Entophlyctis helioformis]|nr:mitochondrial carrier domain-containing protein [Entophlyctis helioformis]